MSKNVVRQKHLKIIPNGKTKNHQSPFAFLRQRRILVILRQRNAQGFTLIAVAMTTVLPLVLS